MHQGNWKCSSCGGQITELPFEPKSTANLLCRDCHSEKRKAGGGEGGERQMFEGDWQCADCGSDIKKLPFEPRGDTSNLRCIDCFKKQKGVA